MDIYLVEIGYPVSYGVDFEYFKIIAESKEEAENKALEMCKEHFYRYIKAYNLNDSPEGHITRVIYEE